MTFLILSEISVGILLMLLTIPLAKVGRGFFAFHAGLALALEIMALTLDWTQLRIHALYAASLLLLTLLFNMRKLRWAPLLLKVTAAFGAGALVAGAFETGNLIWKITSALAFLSSALVLGSILVTMNLGHWYLVIQGLPFELLGMSNRTFVRALILRIGCILGGTLLALDAWKSLFAPSAEPLWYTALFLTVRLTFGIAAPLLLAWTVHECVKIKSNQAATGILYVMLVFVLIGELSGIYFIVERGVPL